jgi:hypothetical protein
MRVEGTNFTGSEAIFHFIKCGYPQISSLKQASDISLCYWLICMTYNKGIAFLQVCRFQGPKKATVQRLDLV